MIRWILFASFALLSAEALSQQEEKRMVSAQEIIDRLDLKPLEGEGGYFRRTYSSSLPALPARVFGINSPSERAIISAIYYLMTPDGFSAFHRLKSDEIFHFYSGDPVEMVQIDERDILHRFVIGSDILKGERPQVLVRKGVWQASRIVTGGRWALLGTTVSPGFEYEDCELGSRSELLKLFPQYRDDVLRLTRE